MNRLPASKRAFSALVEGNSINSIVCMTGVSKHTVLNLLEDVGCAAAAYHDAYIRSVPGRRVQVDEARAFCYDHGHAVALHLFHYNFIRIHQTLRVTPAMEAGIANHVWSFEELIALLDVKQPQQVA